MSRYFQAGKRTQEDGPNDALGRSRETHCVHGHLFDEANTYWTVNWKGYNCRNCRECQKIRMQRKRENPDFKANEASKMRRWRKANKDEYLAKVREDRRKKKEWLDSLKVQCIKCSETHVSCLEFHHRDPEEKDFLLSVGVAKFSLERLQAEVDKCDVICSNCHRKHHYDERQK